MSISNSKYLLYHKLVIYCEPFLWKWKTKLQNEVMIEWTQFYGFRVILGNCLLNLSIPGNAFQPLKWKSAGMMQAMNQITVIVRWSGNEMTHHLWPNTPRKRTLGQCDYPHTVARCVFEPSKAGLPLTNLHYATESLSLSEKTPYSRPRVNIDSDSTVR